VYTYASELKRGGFVKRIAAIVLIALVSLTRSVPMYAGTQQLNPQARAAQKQAKKQQKELKKQAEKQQKALKKSIKAQQKAYKKAQKNAIKNNG
jgi:mannitol-specific phosphotransferase system IIBC component